MGNDLEGTDLGSLGGRLAFGQASLANQLKRSNEAAAFERQLGGERAPLESDWAARGRQELLSSAQIEFLSLALALAVALVVVVLGGAG